MAGGGGAVGEHYMRVIRGDDGYGDDGGQHQEKPGAAVSVAKERRGGGGRGRCWRWRG